MEPTGNYRDKYRRAIDEQERMEKQFAFQLDALRKTLLHVSAAAQGLDKQLDATLIGLKEKMRGASGQQVIEQMDRVQKAALEFEQSRHTQNFNNIKHLTALVNQLNQLKLPNNVKQSLEKFSEGLKKRLVSYRNYPEVFDEFRKLQQIALEAAANPPTTFWQRLKGGTTLKGSQEERSPASEKTRKDTLEEENNSSGEEISEEEMDLSPKEGEIITANQRSIAELKFEAGDEENYHQVAQRIARTLEGLVNNIEPNEVVKHKVDIVRLRIQRGMDWYVLAVTLEDIRDILLLRYLQNDQDFSEYLKNINEELRTIGEALGLVIVEDTKAKEASHKFSTTVTDQVKKMQRSMDGSDSVDHLKSAVKDHLSAIQSALEDYNGAQKKDEIPLSEQLRVLVERVQTIEHDSQKTKELLEEERFKATHDTLTGLPNREAYNERSYQEMQRYKRYCRPLTMAVCDIDFFKKINDQYGHAAGDKVLKLIGKLISTRLRKVDFVGRYGGEEFVIIMPETPPKKAFEVLDKIRALIAKTPFRFKDSPVQITISFGIADFHSEDSVESVFERADKSLYEAKDQGRNRCVIADVKAAPKPISKPK